MDNTGSIVHVAFPRYGISKEQTNPRKDDVHSRTLHNELGDESMR
jgi:hypothetical protein